jgi:hypothetical protein
MRIKNISIMAAAVFCLPTIAHAQQRIVAPEHLQTSRPYGTSMPSSMAQARSDVAAHRAAARHEPKIRTELHQIGQVAPYVELQEGEIARVTVGPAYVQHEQAAPLSGWTFALLTFRQFNQYSTVKREPYGVFTGKNECEMARARKIVELDERNLRQHHSAPNSPIIFESDGAIEASRAHLSASKSTFAGVKGPIETMNVSECAADADPSTDSQIAQKN